MSAKEPPQTVIAAPSKSFFVNMLVRDIELKDHNDLPRRAVIENVRSADGRLNGGGIACEPYRSRRCDGRADTTVH